MKPDSIVTQQDKVLRVFFGHHKCMTSWVNRLIDRISGELKWKYFNIFDARRLPTEVPEFVQLNGPDIISYSDPDPTVVRDLGNLVGFHIIRDPRDVLVSAYFSHLHSHRTEEWPELIDHRAQLRRLSKRDGLLLEMEFRSKEFEQMYMWNYSQSNILELKMEDVIKNPYEHMVRALLFIGMADDAVPLKTRVLAQIASRIRRGELGYLYRLPALFVPDVTLLKIPVELLLTYIYEQRFSAFAEGRDRGNEDVRSHYRKGIAGDWKNHLEDIHLERFKDRYNDLVLKLGYEATADW